MPGFSQFNTIITLPKLHEASSLHSIREPESQGYLWKFHNSVAEASNKHGRDIAQLNREIKNINNRKKLGFDLFPFKIYVLPDSIRTNNQSNTNTTNWRTVRVRGGYVLTDTVSTGSYVQGCDGFQEYAYGNTYNVTSASADIVLNTNSFYWFWIEEIGTSYNIRYGVNPVTSSTGNPNPWTSFPTADAQHIPIGYVDTEASASIQQALIRNLIDSDIVIKGGNGSSYAAWNYTSSYNVGTDIFVDFTKSQPLSMTTTNSVNFPPLSGGHFRVVIPVPDSSSRNSGNLYYPHFPTLPPSASVTVSGSTYNQVFFQPLAPVQYISSCINNVTVDGFGYWYPFSASYVFSLPYTG